MRQVVKPALKSSRWIVQLLMVVIIIGGASLRNILSPDSTLVRFWPELQAFCPFGAVQTIFRSILDGSHLMRTGYSSQWVLLGVFTITILFGAVFCGTLCPLGSLQEWIGKLGRRLLKKRYNPSVPRRIDMLLKSMRIAILALLFFAVSGFIMWDIDFINPSYALSHLWTSVVPLSAVAVLVLFLLLSLVYERPWCRWFCPYGLVLGALGRFGLFTIRRSDDRCINCKICDRACPVHIPVSARKSVTDVSCNRCMKCVTSCPVPETLVMTSPGAVKVRPIFLSFLALVLFFTPLTVAAANSWYSPSSPPAVVISTETAEFSVNSISPMISLSTLADQIGMSQDMLVDLLGLPRDYDVSTLLMDIEEEDEFMDITVRFIREKIHDYLQD